MSAKFSWLWVLSSWVGPGGFNGTDGTPAPYFDNVALRVYPVAGPFITTRELEMFQDNFPTVATLGAEGTNDIKLDMANDIIGDAFPEIAPGDSATFTITAVNANTTLDVNSIMMHFALAVNPNTAMTFRGNLDGTGTDPVLNPAITGTVTGPDGSAWNIWEGDILGEQVTNANGPIPDRFFFSPPDEDFFYPGDVLHYYITAHDGVEPGWMPFDRSGFGEFFVRTNVTTGDTSPAISSYNSSFTIHGLPTLYDTPVGIENRTQPKILFWNDFANRGGENEWEYAFAQNGMYEGLDYDVYYTNAPSSGVSNGLGSRSTVDWLSGYSIMLYTAGDLSSFTLAGNNQDSDKSDDLSRINEWLLTGSKGLFCTGDAMVKSLMNETIGAYTGPSFVSTWLGVTYVDGDVASTIGNQTAPVVIPSGGSIMTRDFVAYGACPSINTFDEITLNGATMLAEFAAPDEVTGTGVPAVVSFVAFGSKVVTSIVDFSYWYTPDGQTGTYQNSARATNLNNILTGFGYTFVKQDPSAAPAAMPFFARNYPNPFNPITKIEFSVPKAGPVSVKIYNVRGELVRTLVDETMKASLLETREWNGTNDRSESVASGVYFYETRTNGNVAVNKMALVK